MGYKIRERACARCGELFIARQPSIGDVLCVECGLDHAADAARQMAAKSGPLYDKWLQTRGPKGRPRQRH